MRVEQIQAELAKLDAAWASRRDDAREAEMVIWDSAIMVCLRVQTVALETITVRSFRARTAEVALDAAATWIAAQPTADSIAAAFGITPDGRLIEETPAC